mgnify:FL=1
MALKKPSELNGENKEIKAPEVIDTPMEEQSIESPHEGVAPSLLIIDSAFKNIQEQILSANKKQLQEYREDIIGLYDLVDDLVNDKLPKYKKTVYQTDLRVESKIKQAEKKIFEQVEVLTENFKDTTSSTVKEVRNLLDSRVHQVKESIDKKYSREHGIAIRELREEVFGILSKKDFDISVLGKKLNEISESYQTLKEETEKGNLINEGLLNGPLDPSDPLSKTEFVTIEQLNKHYSLFVNRVQEQLSTLGGGGETRLQYLDDIVGIATNASAYDGMYLRYDHATKKFVFSTVSAPPQQTAAYANVAGIATFATTAGVATYAPTAGIATEATTAGYATNSGIATYASTAGIATEATTAGYATNSGIATYASTAGIATYASTAGIATFANDADIQGEKSILYVAKDGNDSNSGELTKPKLTIKAAVQKIIDEGLSDTVVRVAPGSYIEDNPIVLPNEVSVIGASIRETTVTPQNADQDIFHVGNANYIAEMSFTGTQNAGKAVVAFDPVERRYISRSTYVQNCTNFIPNNIGMKIDGDLAIGPLKSMVVDSYTQYNQGGIGCSITNNAYAQLVSMFTICCDTAITTGSGGACDLSNSNSSFGNFGLVADGVSDLSYTGVVTTAAAENTDVFAINLNNPTLNVVNAGYTHTTGMLRVETDGAHKFLIGAGVTINNMTFSCNEGNSIYPSGNLGYVFNAEAVAEGTYYDGHTLIAGNRQHIIDQSYAAIGVAYPSFVQPDPEKCKRDIGHVIDAVTKDIRDKTSKNTLEATKRYFTLDGSALISNGVAGEVPQTLVGFSSARVMMKEAITNQLPFKDLTILPDPGTGSNTDPASCSGPRSFIDNLVGILTTRLAAGNIVGANELPAVSMASTVFTVNVGVSTIAHTYVSGGDAALDVPRPHDGQVIYFDRLYNTVKKVNISDQGTYTSQPSVVFSDPETDWGVKATGIPVLENGKIVGVDMISNGRGYVNPPTVTFSTPQSGINTAVGKAELTPTYYTIAKATAITNDVSLVTLTENVPFAVGVGTVVNFFKQSRILATSHSFEFVGSGNDISRAIPYSGGIPPIPENETDSRNGGLVIYTSTNQAGNFKIGDGVIINQVEGRISGQSYSKSLVSTMTPYILSLGGF